LQRAKRLPNFDKVYCVASKYGKLAPKWPAAFDDIWAFADDYDPKQEIFSFNTSTPPPDFSPVEGDTARGSSWPGGGTTILYAAGLSPNASTRTITFTDPTTGVTGTIAGPYSTVEWATATLAHEIWHQNGSDDEDKAEGYGYAVLKKFRSDGGKLCP
jgi:hypothetical protein